MHPNGEKLVMWSERKNFPSRPSVAALSFFFPLQALKLEVKKRKQFVCLSRYQKRMPPLHMVAINEIYFLRRTCSILPLCYNSLFTSLFRNKDLLNFVRFQLLLLLICSHESCHFLCLLLWSFLLGSRKQADDFACGISKRNSCIEEQFSFYKCLVIEGKVQQKAFK